MHAPPGSEMGGESEADGTSHAGSAFQDGLSHDASAPKPYHYFVVSSHVEKTVCLRHPRLLAQDMTDIRAKR